MLFDKRLTLQRIRVLLLRLLLYFGFIDWTLHSINDYIKENVCLFPGELIMIVEYCRFGNIHNYLQKHREVFIDQLNDHMDKGAGRVNRAFSSSSGTSGWETLFKKLILYIVEERWLQGEPNYLRDTCVMIHVINRLAVDRTWMNINCIALK